MIIENELMWPPSCNRWRIGDDIKGVYDNLIHTIYTSAAVKILIPPDMVLKEVEPLEFYDEKIKNKIREQEVRPVLAAAFNSSIEKPWEIDETSDLVLIWDLFEDFFVNLVWCSKLEIPFVYDLDLLMLGMTRIRNELIKRGNLSDPRILNGLIAIMSCYQSKHVWCLRPVESGRGTVLDLWRQLRTDSAYKHLSHETRRLGLMRKDMIRAHISKVRELTTNVTSSRRTKGILSIAKTAISVSLGPIGEFGTDVVTNLAEVVFAKPYVPPIYSLTNIERSFDETFYPYRLES